MNKKLKWVIFAFVVLLIISIAITTCACAQGAEPQEPVMPQASGFRDLVWGATPADVRQFEPGVFYKEEDGSLYFLVKPDEYRRMIKYDFEGGKLWRGTYQYVELEHPNSQSVMDRFVDLSNELNKRYGKPFKEEMLWGSKTYMNFPEYWNRSLLSGDLKFKTEWVSGDTRVILECYHDKEYYQMYYTAEKITDGAGTQGTILNLPGSGS